MHRTHGPWPVVAALACAVAGTALANSRPPKNTQPVRPPSQTSGVHPSKPLNEAEQALGVNLADPIIREANSMVEDGHADDAIATLKERLADKSKSNADGSIDDIRLGLAMVYIRAGKPGEARRLMPTENAFKKPAQKCQARMLRAIMDAQKRPAPLAGREEWLGALGRFRTDAWSRMAEMSKRMELNAESCATVRGVPDELRPMADLVDAVLAARVLDPDHPDGDFTGRFAAEAGSLVEKVKAHIGQDNRKLHEERSRPHRLQSGANIASLETCVKDANEVVTRIGVISSDANQRYH